MTSRLLAFAIAFSASFYGAIPLLYLFPHVAENKVVGRAMFMMAFVVVAPTWVALGVRLRRVGLREGGVCRASGSQV
jgi:hypothetical protein